MMSHAAIRLIVTFILTLFLTTLAPAGTAQANPLND